MRYVPHNANHKSHTAQRKSHTARRTAHITLKLPKNMHLNSTFVLNILIIHAPEDAQAREDIRHALKKLHKLNKSYVINIISFDGADLSDTGRALLLELLKAADLVLTLMSDVSIISALFICQEMRAAIKMQMEEKLTLVPIVLRTCWWEDTIYKHLEVLPRAGMPLYEGDNELQAHLFDELVDSLQERLMSVRQRKLEIEESYKTILAEADKLFESWQTRPELLRKALPLYKEALEHWREGFQPLRTVLEARIQLCGREINFYHYAQAAQEAAHKGDEETAYFNCKDALELREDANIRALFEQLDKKFKAEDAKSIREPFDKHIKAANDFFLKMEWEAAKDEYTHALEFYEPEFSPSKESIQYKIDTCKREHALEFAMRKVKIYYQIQDYTKVVEYLSEAVREINKEAFDKIEQMLRMLRDIEQAEPFYESRSQRWGYYRKDTQAVIIAPKYNAAFSFSENLAGVKKWEKWGFIDIEGNEIIPFEYDFVGHFRNGAAEVVRNKQMYFINHRGERIAEPEVRKLS
jgi:hypothetical protein